VPSTTGGLPTLSIYLVNVPACELAGGRIQASKKDEAQHVQAYFNLFGEGCTAPSAKFYIRHAEDHYPKDPGNKPSECPIVPEPYALPSLALTDGGFVDPANCTVGAGCGDDYPC
jgi:hypothetical protein